MNKKWEKKRKSMITTCKIIVWNAGYKETLVMKINYKIHVDQRGYEVSHFYKGMRTRNPAHPSKHVKAESDVQKNDTILDQSVWLRGLSNTPTLSPIDKGHQQPDSQEVS